MQYFIIIVIVSVLHSFVGTSTDGKTQTQEELLQVTNKLNDCEKKLNDNSYLGQVCSRVGTWLTKDTSLKRGPCFFKKISFCEEQTKLTAAVNTKPCPSTMLLLVYAIFLQDSKKTSFQKDNILVSISFMQLSVPVLN